jgi:hypothetical protein
MRRYPRPLQRHLRGRLHLGCAFLHYGFRPRIRAPVPFDYSESLTFLLTLSSESFKLCYVVVAEPRGSSLCSSLRSLQLYLTCLQQSHLRPLVLSLTPAPSCSRSNPSTSPLQPSGASLVVSLCTPIPSPSPRLRRRHRPFPYLRFHPLMTP